MDISPFLPSVESKKDKYNGAYSYHLLKEVSTVNTLQEIL